MTLRETMDLTNDRGNWRSFTRTHHRQMAGVKTDESGRDDDDDDDDDPMKIHVHGERLLTISI